MTDEKQDTTPDEPRRTPVDQPDPSRGTQGLPGTEPPAGDPRDTPPADYTGADPDKDWSQPK